MTDAVHATSIGERIVSLRADMGISQGKLASEMGVIQPAISHVETNRRTPSLQLAIKLANFFDVTLDELIGRDVSALRRKSDKDMYPEQYAAHVAVTNAINRGSLTQAKEHGCIHCDKQAEEWHHPSYHPDHHLDVVALCRTCHKKTHSGLIRIAIASA